MSNIIVIEQPWGGLGDNLQYTTLPQLYSELGFNVYISSKNTYRNPEIYDLVWKLNPYIKGISDEPPNAGACTYFQGLHKSISEHSIRNIEYAHGINFGVEKYPKIYYNPKTIEDLKNTIIIDTTNISAHITFDISYIEQQIKKIINMYPSFKPLKIHFKNISNRNLESLQCNTYIIDNIFQYCDVINSCKIFISVPSGCSNLASSIKQDREFPIIYCINDPSKFSFKPGDNHWHSNRIIISE
jgi:hypothetical protein